MAGVDSGTSGHAARAPRASRLRIGVAVAMQARIDRDALVALLATQPDFALLGSAGNIAETVALCLARRPRVLVLDTLADGSAEAPAAAVLGLAAPGTRILSIAPHGAERCALLNPAENDAPAGCPLLRDDHRTCIELALAHGALGALRRDATAEELFTAVRTVAEGRPWIAPGLLTRPAPVRPLTTQESRVARRVGAGDSNKEIAAVLGISELTVKKHVGQVLHKLGLHDRLQLGLCVARHPLAFRVR
jgi:DNA-binding NarL/FixJ family response regulator